MKKARPSPLMEVTPEIAARCNGPDQFEKFDRLATSFLTTPKVTLLKEDPPHRKAAGKRKRS